MFKFIAFKEVSCAKLGRDEWKEEHLTIYIVADASQTYLNVADQERNYGNLAICTSVKRVSNS
jgi:hypothetical protein